MQFHGSFEALSSLVSQLAIPCRWEHKGAWKLCVFDDGVSNLKLNWWPASGELRLVGDPEVRPAVQNRLEALLDAAQAQADGSADGSGGSPEPAG